MRTFAWVAFLLVHVHVQASDATCAENSETETCDNVASAASVSAERSLLQRASHTERGLSMAPKALSRGLKLAVSDVFLFDHLPKAGGSFVRGILNNSKVINPDNVKILFEEQGVTVDDRDHMFTVGSVRNPCEYYVSCWSYGGKIDTTLWHKQNRSFFNTSLEYYGVTEELNTPEDALRFQKWLRYILPREDPPGLQTARMLWSYANETVATAQMPEPTLQGWPEESRLVYFDAMLKFNPASIDCWIRTESLTDDLRSCMQRFDERAGGNMVNWVEFNATVDQRSQEHQTMNWTTGTDNGVFSEATETYLWTKRTGHQSCDFYFDDPSRELIRKMDSMVFEKFGYTTCCEPGSAH